LDSKAIALTAARVADEKKATDIIIQKVKDLFLVSDYFVIVSGQNNRQVNAIVDAIEERIRNEYGIKPLGREGSDECTWVLLDYGDVIVHVFQPEIREFYRLETLWNDAPIVDVSEAGIIDPVYTERIAKIIGQ
jgi:ribosome-associated protein